ncbi:hypothetical protein DAI22_07g118866 [Oryza sativa Japonica Group]|nr:hypothetical protein DAI22_07g118866 [Oryza sativa Japonica Group]
MAAYKRIESPRNPSKGIYTATLRPKPPATGLRSASGGGERPRSSRRTAPHRTASSLTASPYRCSRTDEPRTERGREAAGRAEASTPTWRAARRCAGDGGCARHRHRTRQQRSGRRKRRRRGGGGRGRGKVKKAEPKNGSSAGGDFTIIVVWLVEHVLPAADNVFLGARVLVHVLSPPSQVRTRHDGGGILALPVPSPAGTDTTRWWRRPLLFPSPPHWARTQRAAAAAVAATQPRAGSAGAPPIAAPPAAGLPH